MREGRGRGIRVSLVFSVPQVEFSIFLTAPADARGACPDSADVAPVCHKEALAGFVDKERIFVNGSGLEDPVGVEAADDFEVAADDAFVAEDAADLFVSIDGNAAAIRSFDGGRIGGEEPAAKAGGGGGSGAEGRSGNEKEFTPPHTSILNRRVGAGLGEFRNFLPLSGVGKDMRADPPAARGRSTRYSWRD
jgi:hypothetical protein